MQTHFLKCQLSNGNFYSKPRLEIVGQETDNGLTNSFCYRNGKTYLRALLEVHYGIRLRVVDDATEAIIVEAMHSIVCSAL